MLRTGSLLLSAVILAPSAAMAHDRNDFASAPYRVVASPFSRVEPSRHRQGVVWIEGHREWRGRRRVWIPGHWEQVRPVDYRDYRGMGRRDHRDDGPYYRTDYRPDERYYGTDYRVASVSRPVSIAGQVIGGDGRPVPGITLVLAGNAESRAVTGPDGRYQFADLEPGSYAVRPTDPRWSFAPDVVNLSYLDDSTVQNFSAACH